MKDPAKYEKKWAIDSYYVYYDKYPPWAFDIVILSYISQVIVAERDVDIKTKITASDVEDILEIFDKHLRNCDVFRTGFSKEEIDQFGHIWRNYIRSFLDKPWETVFIEIQQRYLTWDNYSLAVIFFFLLNDIFYRNNIRFSIIRQFEDVLKRAILIKRTDDNKITRPSTDETIKAVRILTKNIKLAEYREMNNTLSSVSRTLEPRQY
jgi:SpoVK/Ycf46/Vps4 family AAA+-type ATPase